MSTKRKAPAMKEDNAPKFEDTSTVNNSEPSERRQRSRTSSTVYSRSYHGSSLLRGLTELQFTPGSRHGPVKFNHLSSESFVKRLEQQPPLKGHSGCVNTLAWDETGEFLLTGSDDHYLNIYRPLDPIPLVQSIPSGHTGNVFSAKFMAHSSSSLIVSCCSNGTTRLTNVHRFVEKSRRDAWVPSPGFNCHESRAMTYEVMPDMVDGHIFYDCSEDGRINRYDTRIRTSCDCNEDEGCERHTFIDIKHHSRGDSTSRLSGRTSFSFARFRLDSTEMVVSAITQRPENPNYIAAACGDDTVRIYDSRMIRSRDSHREAQVYSFSPYVPPGWKIGEDGELVKGKNRQRNLIGTKITSLKYDPCRTGQLLASYSRGNCFLIDPSGMTTELNMQWNPTKKSSHHAIPDSVGKKSPTTDVKGKRRRSPSAGVEPADQLGLESAGEGRRTLGSWSPMLPRKSSVSSASSEAAIGTSSELDEPMHITKDIHDINKAADPTHGKSAGQVRFQFQDPVTELDEDESIDGERSQQEEQLHEDTDHITQSNNNESVSEDGVDIDVDLILQGNSADDDDEDDYHYMDQDSDGHSHTDSFGLESDDSDDEDELTPVEQDEKEYWIRRSFHAGKSDIVQVYSGHRNADTMIKEANFIGPNSEFIISGSDDGRILFWDKQTASGIDDTIKIFMPTASEPVDLSLVRGIKRPTAYSHEIRPAAPVEKAPESDSSEGRRKEDYLDPQLAYVQERRSFGQDNLLRRLVIINDEDDDYSEMDDDDDDMAPRELLMQIIRQFARRHRQGVTATRVGSSSNPDAEQENEDEND
ncbi:DDB1- and CUL4-associated factor 6 [Lobosporangium transversale]|nr:DDB1- and CUL4-associated factor 6 [Lobosporangium transversale]